ncbi:hypothetical protein PHLGIDRAFT_82176 [Phlebiopsis gigantea 11061_1 CR5-6]|uniref:YTH domain-containing protein n=1 Tax=Phlebiopsis gigantea (strain 11061_1 CR5-6) TaxID=745531 RepID=A0A0C3S7E0_PHLG1|nr:hypothetical protein PHLGIDRAFT_82176 [Phlebiopsis gigantea 11061_1 CR5-6]
MSQQGHSVSPPPGPAASGNSATGVRRHHTISASSRSTRPLSKIQTQDDDDDEQDAWAQDEVVDQDWRGGIGAVGEKSSLHRQASLPTKYHRAFGGPGQRQPGNHTPRTMNSLSAIAGHEGDEEEWEREMRGIHNDDEGLSSSDNGHQEASASPLSPHFSGGISHISSPSPDSGANVRRHQSLNYPNPAAARFRNSGLRRADTMQAPPIKERTPQAYPGPQSPSPTGADEEHDYDNDSVRAEEDGYFRASNQQNQGQYPTSPIGRSSPWGTPSAGNDWRTQLHGIVNPNIGPGPNGIDDVSRALSALEINQQYAAGNPGNGYQQGQSAYPPRFNPPQNFNLQSPGMHNNGGAGNGASRKLQLVTDLGGGVQQGSIQSASAYVPPIGHGIQQHQNQRQGERDEQQQHYHRDRAFTASGSNPWDSKEQLLGGRMSNPNLHGIYQTKNGGPGVPSVPQIPTQYLNNQGQAPRMGQANYQQAPRASSQGSNTQSPPADNIITSPIDVPTLIAAKGYNPAEFDTRPLFARYFVIKSYTEDDVHKSLKYEIWSSTDPGNKRLDKAFKENTGRGPIYLFFSVNASGHFCGMAEMLTAVDYSRSSTVWASDKWKGVFKVRWIFVRDIPNSGLRHIRLNNTQERKPVTNSRDTQELLPEAGQEMLRIFHSHPARTSLLQDFAFYELQAFQKQQQVQSGTSSPDPSNGMQSNMQSPVLGPATPSQHPFAMSNPAALAYAAQLSGMNMMNMNPMLQMQMNLSQMSNMSAAFANPHTMQSVMRHPSPGPMGGQNYMSMGGMPGF